jgi:CheY-like chemotaxis protein
MSTKKTVLVLDDEFLVRDALAAVLGDAGYPVVCAKNGSEALAYLTSQSPPGLILLDLRMPGMDGFEFRAEQLRNPKIADIPVIVFSADGSLERCWRDLDASSVIAKPVDLDELLFHVERHCG